MEDTGATTFSLTTFGCQMNRHDSERIAGLLLEHGYVEAPRAQADVVLFNTCCVREGAAERLRGQVTELAPLKRRRPEVIIGVLGCLAQAEGDQMLETLPLVDLVVGTHRLPELPGLLDEARRACAPVVDVGDDERFLAELAVRRESPVQAWLAITAGCDNRCTYCIVPHVRGPERSRSIDGLLAETERLKEEGVLEVTLIGQNVNSYGRDLYGAPRFAELLRGIDEIGIGRIRFTTSHPKDFSDEVIEAMAGCVGVCEHVHLPAQAGSDRVLERMGRGYTRDEYLERVRRLTEAVPDVAVSTDLMVAFPGETREDFSRTVELVEEVGFSQAFTFIYSPRPGTPASRLEEDVSRAEARRRMSELVGAVNRAAAARSATRVGTIAEVLIEGPAKHGEGKLMGRDRRGQTVIVDAGSSLPHQLVRTRIVEAHTWFLLGEVIADGRTGPEGIPDTASAHPRT